MTKYDPLKWHLSKLNSAQWRATFAEIERILGFSLPASAHNYAAWWGNKKRGHAQTEAWMDAGWDVDHVDLRGKKVSFVKGPALEGSARPRLKEGTAGQVALASLNSIPWPWDLGKKFGHRIAMTWMPIGRVTIDESGKVTFPKPPERPGLYRFQVKTGARLAIYIGESDNLSRRFGNYRNPGSTQPTNLRINELFRKAISDNAEVGVAIATDVTLADANGESVTVDLSVKAYRRLFENYAQVVGGGIDIETLNR